jgi:hypothetical protein
MKKMTIIGLIALMSTSVVFPQTNHIYGEGLGVGLLGSINYEREVMDKVFARVGIARMGGTTTVYEDDYYGYGDPVEADFSIMPVIVGASYLMGNKWKLELGGGISYWMVSGNLSWGDVEGEEEDAALMTFYGVGGVRYQNPLGGITARAGLSFLMIEDVSVPWPHISLGYGF